MKAKVKIKKEDRVMVIAGRDKGKVGKVIRVYPEKNTALVERVNMIKRHTRAGQAQSGQGGIIEKEAAISLSNLKVMCDKCAGPVRVGHKVLEDGVRVRICKKCGEQLEAK